jgi:hypothetical protein
MEQSMKVYAYEEEADGTIVLTAAHPGLVFDSQANFERFCRKTPEKIGEGTFMLVETRPVVTVERIEQYKLTVR